MANMNLNAEERTAIKEKFDYFLTGRSTENDTFDSASEIPMHTDNHADSHNDSDA